MKNIKTNQLVPNQNTINLYGNTEDVKLILSISPLGILEPFIVFPLEDSTTQHYQIVSGNRRKKAAELVGLNEVPCTIVEPENESVQTIMCCSQYFQMRYVHVSIVNSKSNYGETSLITIVFDDVSRFISKIDSINNAVGYQSFEISVEPDDFLFEDAEIEQLMDNNIFVMQ